ncbi:sortase [Paenibacillus sp. H1-7]|nr:sortase [Paenibacillus sp. H1-7]
MDHRNRAEEENRHTVIYGHNMKDGSMFGQLKRYEIRNFSAPILHSPSIPYMRVMSRRCSPSTTRQPMSTIS